METPNNHARDDAVDEVRRAEEGIASAPHGESVEALEEALAAARARLQERLAVDVEAQRRDLAELQRESERFRADAEATVGQANQTAQQVLRDVHHAAERMRQEAAEGAERVMREAEAKAERTMADATRTASTMLERVLEHADRFLSSAANDLETLRAETASPRDTGEDAEEAAEEEEDVGTRLMDAPGGDPTEAQDTAGRAPGIVTRVVVRPLVGANTRSRIKERLEALPGVQAVKLGPLGAESFEVLLVHPREARVKEHFLALSPEQIVLKDQKVGYLEIELKDVDWVEVAVPNGAPAAQW